MKTAADFTFPPMPPSTWQPYVFDDSVSPAMQAWNDQCMALVQALLALPKAEQEAILDEMARQFQPQAIKKPT